MSTEPLKPTIAGPGTEALGAAIEAAFAPLLEASEVAVLLDTQEPAWDAARPDLSLHLLGAQRDLLWQGGVSPAEQYRRIRLQDTGHWSRNLWTDLMRLAAVWIQESTANPDLVRIYTWPLSVAFLFAANVAPSATDLDTFRTALLRTIPDVASYAILVGAPGAPLSELLTLDIGPGLDIGLLADEIGP